MRFGCIVGNSETIDNISRLFNGKNISSISIIAGIEVLRNNNYYRNNIEIIKLIKIDFMDKLHQLGLKYFASETNFIVVHIGDKVDQLYEYFCHHDILVKKMVNHGTYLDNSIRISIGDEQYMSRVKACLTKFLAK